MNNKAQFTPLISEVMAHYNLSDDEWDCLSSFTKQKLSTVYAKHAAAPAMYEALQSILEFYEWSNSNGAEQAAYDKARAALAQAEGRQG